MARIYATLDDYADYLDGPVPADFQPVLLRRASLRLDRRLVGAVYPVNDAGMPTDPLVVEALREATCALAEWWDDQGENGSGSTDEWSEIEVGNVRLRKPGGTGQSASAPRPDRLPSTVLDVLHTCVKTDGRPLLPHAVQVYG